MPKVSVIIPCYNQGVFLNEAVASVLDQTFQDFEILVVDDGSTDAETVNMLRDAIWPKTRVIHTENQGLSAARNNGIREAQGAYILPLDADDKIGDGYLADAVRILDRYPEIGIVYCEAAYFGVKGGRWDLPEYSLDKILNQNVIFCTALFRKEDWEAVGGYNVNMVYGWEDWDFWLSLIQRGLKVYRIPKIYFYYRLREVSMVHAMDEEQNFFMRLHACLNHRDLYRQFAKVDIQCKVMELYVDTGMGYQLKQCLRQIVFADQRQISFDLRGYRGIRGFRLDPINSRVLMHVQEIALVGRDGTRRSVSDYRYNAALRVGDNLLFDTEDPQILIEDLPDGEIESLDFRFQFLSLGDEVFSDILHLKEKALSQTKVEMAKLESVLHGAELELHSKEYEIQQQRVQLKDVREQLKDRADLIAQQKEQLKDRTDIIAQQKEQLKQRADLIAQRENQLRQRENDIMQIFQSRSWKVTKPLRILSELFQKGANYRKIFRIIILAVQFRVWGWVDFVRAYLTIEQSGLFDAECYRQSLAGTDVKGVDLLAHYLARGAKEGRDPNPLFDAKFYQGNHPEILQSGLNPLFHYIQYGAPAGKRPHPLFDTAYYLRKYPDVSTVDMNPLAHYLKHGVRDGRNPIPLFDTSFYLKKNPEVGQMTCHPLVHYLQKGAWEKRDPHPLFHSDYYLTRNKDVADSGVNPLVHYLAFGAQEGRKPNPIFDSAYYAEKNPEVAASGMNPLSHYIEEGISRGLNPGPLFDVDYYVRVNPDVTKSGVDPLSHYLEFGIREGRYPNNVYKIWLHQHALTKEDRERIVGEIQSLTYLPLFSIIVPVYNTDEKWLRKCLDSVLAQLYPHWELCIADDASPMPHVRKILEEYTSKDPRIRVAFREENGHISACSNSALEMVRGEFIALLDHDDEITADALYENASLLNRHPDADMIYSDEDKMNEDGERHSPFFKPDWSPDTFLSHMYTCHLGVYRAELIRKIGGFRVGFEGSQDYDLVLRFTEQTTKIHHIPKVLYHWRTIKGSTALTHEAKNYAYVSGLNAIDEALKRRGENGRVEHVDGYPGQYLVRYSITGDPRISIIIPTRDNAVCLNRCLKSLFSKTTYGNFEVILIDNGSQKSETKQLFTIWQEQKPEQVRVLNLDVPFNFPRLNNEGARHAEGDLLCLLNDDTEVITPGWLEEMAGQAVRPSIGAVGAFLLYPDDKIQHAGLILGIVGPANHGHKGMPADSAGYFGRLLVVYNYAAVTGACLMVKKSLYLEMGGLDEALAVAYNDVDFCLRLLQKGYRNMVLPQARLYHHESESRGSDRSGANRKRLGREADLMNERWVEWIRNDPYYSPHLTRDREDFTLRQFSID